MAINARLRPLNPDEPIVGDDNVVVHIKQLTPEGTLDENGALTTELPDGSVVVDFNPQKNPEINSGFYANLADGKIEEEELQRIASELIEDVEGDIQSRTEWLRIRERGVELLGFKLEDPRSDLGSPSVPLEGMSSIRHPLLAEAVLRFQANARGELLPASGPVKVRNDAPPVPDDVDSSGLQQSETNASALETDFNHYLTTTAREYYPDTDRMLFQVGFGGLGVKKVYNCPIRRRPVSESIDPADFIVSNTSTDLQSAGRVTHRIKMRPSILKRMQLIGAYRDTDITFNSALNLNVLEKKVNETQGIRPDTMIQKPETVDQEIYEVYCELDIKGLEHKKKNGKITGLRLPYKVSIHVASKKVLELRRNYLKEDELFMPREYFVDFPFIPAFGFYPLGLIHILGNTTSTLTAAWREMLDAGMFASFPGFLYSKMAGRQLTNQFRVPPGGGVPIDVGSGSIKDAIMPLPYKEPGPSLTAFIQHVEEVGQRLGSTADTNVGEGKQDAPVGTTLALIEQATKMLDAVHKRLHSAQAKEFQLLKDRFKEDPEAFWRFNRKPAMQWEKDQFLAALENSEVVPVADPNNPTSLHRIAKATAIKQLQAASPLLYDSMAVDKRIMKIVGVDAEGLFLDKPADPPPDPRMEAIKAKSESEQARSQIEQSQSQTKAASVLQASHDKAADRESRERIEAMKIMLEKLKIQEEQIIHAHDAELKAKESEQSMAIKQQEGQQKIALSQAQHEQKMQHEQQKGQMDMVAKAHDVNANMQIKSQELESKRQLAEQANQDKLDVSRQAQQDRLEQSREAHQGKLQQTSEAHTQKLEQTKQLNQEKIKTTKAMAKAKPKPAAKPKGSK